MEPEEVLTGRSCSAQLELAGLCPPALDPCELDLPEMPPPSGLLYRRCFSCPPQQAGGAGAGSPSLREAAEALQGVPAAPWPRQSLW